MEDKEPIIALICGVKTLKGSNIAFLTYDQFRDCIGRGFKTPRRSVTVKHFKGSKHFNIYGTGLDSVSDYREITSNITSRLEEIAGLTKEVNIR